MQSVSNEFKELAKSNARISLAKFIIKDSNTEIDGETIIDGFIEEPTCDDTSLVGNVMAKNLETSIYNNFTNDFIGKEIYAYTGQQLEDETEEYVSRGTFIIDEIEEDISSGALKLKGLDYAIKFNKAWEDSLDWENNTYTLGEFAKAVCEFCELELETEEFTNSDYVLTQQPAFEGYQCRYVMQRIAEIATSNVFISPEDKVQIRLAPQNYVSAEGSSITLEESANSRLKIDEFEGEITQLTTNGYNVYADTNNLYNKVTDAGQFTKANESDGGLRLTKTTSGTTSPRFAITLTDEGTYTFSCKVKGTAPKVIVGTILNNTWTEKANLVPTTNNYQILTFTFDYTSGSNPRIFFRNTNDTTFPLNTYLIINDFMVEKGSTRHDYEIYTGNKPSPSPDYPQKIEVITGRQSVNLVSRNKFDYKKALENIVYSQNTTLSLIDNGIRATLTSVSNYRMALIKFGLASELVGKTIRFTSNNSNSGLNNSRYYIGYCNANGTTRVNVGDSLGVKDAVVSMTVETGIQDYVCVALYSNNNSSSAVVGDYVDYTNIMLTIDDDDMTYEPYKGKSYEINLGKNLFDINLKPSSAIDYDNGFTLLKSTNRVITINLPTTYQPRTYTLSYDIHDSNLTSVDKLGIWLQHSTGGNVIGANDNNNHTLTLNANSDFNKIYFFIAQDQSDTATISINNIQLEVGDKKTSYSSYFTPIFLSKINTYKDFIRRGTGKNLFDKDNLTRINGTINVGTNSYFRGGGANYAVVIPCEPNTTYTVQKRNDGDTNRFAVASSETIPSGSADVDTTLPNAIRNDNASSITITTSSNAKYLVVNYYRNVEARITDQQLRDSIQIELGTQATEYEPYGFKDKWYLYKTIGKVVLNGSESWAKYSGTKRYYLQMEGILAPSTNNNKALIRSNLFTIQTANYTSGATTVDAIALQTDEILLIRYVAYNNETLANFKTWLASNNVIAYYVLSTPIITEITSSNYPELLSQLKAIEKARSMEGITYIDVDSSNLPFKLSLQYDRKDVEDIDINSIMSLEVEDTSYKPYNAVTLALADGIEGENVTLRDESSIALYGERALVITANEFAINQAVREELIEEMFNSINGFNYVPMKLEYNSYDWLERYDRIKVQYDENNYYETYLFNHTTEFPATIKSVIEDVAISENKVKYEFVPETQQKNVHTEIVVDKLNGTISEVVSTQEEFQDSLSQLSVTVDGIQSKVELNYDFVRETSGNNYVSVDDIQQEGLLELKITGTAISSGNLILHITNNVPEYIELPISTILKQGNVADELSIEAIYNEDTELYELHCFIDKKLDYIENQIVTRSSTNNFLLNQDSTKLTTESGEDLLLDDYVAGKQDLGIISIPIQEGQHTFSIENFNNLSYYLKYAVLNNITSEFALKKHIVSEINQSAEQIQISADKVSLTGKTIELTSDNININSDNFKVDEEGNMICNNANVNGVINSTNGNVGGWQITDEGLINDSVKIMNNGGATIYTMADLAIVILHIQGTITLSGELLKHYDLNDDGIVDLRDMVLLQNILKINVQ